MFFASSRSFVEMEELQMDEVGDILNELSQDDPVVDVASSPRWGGLWPCKPAISLSELFRLSLDWLSIGIVEESKLPSDGMVAESAIAAMLLYPLTA